MLFQSPVNLLCTQRASFDISYYAITTECVKDIQHILADLMSNWQNKSLYAIIFLSCF